VRRFKNKKATSLEQLYSSYRNRLQKSNGG
jgi:hypothetical protein